MMCDELEFFISWLKTPPSPFDTLIDALNAYRAGSKKQRDSRLQSALSEGKCLEEDLLRIRLDSLKAEQSELNLVKWELEQLLDQIKSEIEAESLFRGK